MEKGGGGEDLSQRCKLITGEGGNQKNNNQLIYSNFFLS